MSPKNHVYEAWEEQFISPEKDNRVVHYYLKSSKGHSLLAVVGTERSKRHMLYVVSQEFLRAFGSNKFINASTKWRARKDVVQWLISLVRKDDPEPNFDYFPDDKAKEHTSSDKKKEKFEPPKKFVKKTRTCRVPVNQITRSEQACPKLRIKLCGNAPIGIELVEPRPNQKAFPKVGQRIEVLCQDSGMRGCWFRCKVLKASEKRLKVEYNDLENVEGSGKLEEWVPASRLADPDNLGIRYSGRLTVRPWPPRDPSDHSFVVGEAVDAWWSDGWWEGVVTGVSISRSDTIHVCLPGEGKFLTLERKDIRISRDWVDNRWMDIKPKPEVLSSICSSLKPNEKLPTSLAMGEASKRRLGSGSMNCKALTDSKSTATEQEKTKAVPDPNATDNVEKMRLHLKKRFRICNNEFGCGSSADA